jgi:hypothetical protein
MDEHRFIKRFHQYMPKVREHKVNHKEDGKTNSDLNL